MPVAIISPRKKLKKRELKCGRFSLKLWERTHIMGVLNRTPDSFSDGGRFMDENVALRHAREMFKEGADIIDVGGESTRPGSECINLTEELDRTIPVIRKISQELDIPISIDTTKHQVAEEAIKNGATFVNDISGLRSDDKMAEVISKYDVAICLMHMKGAPKDMQESPFYEDLMGEIKTSLTESIVTALKAGIPPDKIVIDPGIGFGKTLEHNLAIINRLNELEVLDKPMLIGVSRKSFIGKVLNKGVDDRLFGTAATSTLAIANGASILRVHDVKEIRDVARMTDAVRKTNL